MNYADNSGPNLLVQGSLLSSPTEIRRPLLLKRLQSGEIDTERTAKSGVFLSRRELGLEESLEKAAVEKARRLSALGEKDPDIKLEAI